jgi:hypothetical protein
MAVTDRRTVHSGFEQVVSRRLANLPNAPTTGEVGYIAQGTMEKGCQVSGSTPRVQPSGGSVTSRVLHYITQTNPRIDV